MAFLTFCFRDAGRARSMKSLWRNLPQVFKACELPDLTQRWPVKKHFKELQDQWSEEPDPCASCTERMAESLLLHVIPSERRPKAPRVGSDDTLLERRDVVQTACGCYAGTRIGETADSGQGHGVTCSGVCIVEDEDTGEAFIDILVPTAKTGVSRYTGMWQYPSENRDIDMVASVRALWDAMGAASWARDTGRAQSFVGRPLGGQGGTVWHVHPRFRPPPCGAKAFGLPVGDETC